MTYTWVAEDSLGEYQHLISDYLKSQVRGEIEVKCLFVFIDYNSCCLVSEELLFHKLK